MLFCQQDPSSNFSKVEQNKKKKEGHQKGTPELLIGDLLRFLASAVGDLLHFLASAARALASDDGRVLRELEGRDAVDSQHLFFLKRKAHSTCDVQRCWTLDHVEFIAAHKRACSKVRSATLFVKLQNIKFTCY